MMLPAFIISMEPSEAVPLRYFPPSFAKPTFKCSLGGRDSLSPVVSDFENQWFSGHLSAAQEPSLYQASLSAGAAGTTIRFTWLRSFHPPVFVRVEGLGTSTPRLIAKQLSGAGGYAPGTITTQVNRQLSTTEAVRLSNLLVQSKVSAEPPKGCDLGCDGAEWLIEQVDQSGYHFVGRWSPKDGPVRRIAMALVALTGWQFKDVY